jgi:triacylglycerol lipase
MSILVRFPKEFYEQHGTTAFDGFSPVTDFSLKNARALMWISQLVYQPEDFANLCSVTDQWRIGPIRSQFGEAATIKTTLLHAENDRQVIIAFAGTDPGMWETVITDVQPILNGDNVHTGFANAFAAVMPQLDTILDGVNGRPVFFTGHSLGAALASLAALHAAERAITATAIYTFGMPRVGGDTFRAKYSPLLGNRTYRLVHGDDLVARVPLSALMGYRHVGRLLQCRAETKFQRQTVANETDEPDLTSILSESADIIQAVPNRGVLSLFGRHGPMGGLVGLAYTALPPLLRHHIQDWYLDALSSGQIVR